MLSEALSEVLSKTLKSEKIQKGRKPSLPIRASAALVPTHWVLLPPVGYCTTLTFCLLSKAPMSYAAPWGRATPR